MRVSVTDLTVPAWATDFKALDRDRVASLAEEARDAGGFEQPIHVLADGDQYIVLDGQHRVEAARRNGWGHVDVVLHAGQGEADALSLVTSLHGEEIAPDAASKMMDRLRDALDRVPDDEAPPATSFSPQEQRLVHDLLVFLHDEKRVHDARLAQLFDLGDAKTAARLRQDVRGLPALEPAHLHEMPPAVQFGVRELMNEHLLARDEVEHLFPLNQRERIHLEAESALKILAGIKDKRVTLKGSRWGPDYEADAPDAVRLVGVWEDGRTRELSLEDVPGLDRYTRGILRKALAGGGPRVDPASDEQADGVEREA